MASKLGFRFDPFELAGKEKPKSGIRALEAEICQYVLDQVLNHVGDGKSPVAGGAWKKSLSPEYKKRKAEVSSALFANMELTGDMLDSLECVRTRDGIELRVVGAKNAAKADGHNNHSGKSRLPPREFIPKEGGSFKRNIISGIRSIIDEANNG